MSCYLEQSAIRTTVSIVIFGKNMYVIVAFMWKCTFALIKYPVKQTVTLLLFLGWCLLDELEQQCDITLCKVFLRLLGMWTKQMSTFCRTDVQYVSRSIIQMTS